ncbi:hypothetical protein M885DRAFT_111232 [Pelagophyceae sp. CCMP2097]|nr:hypothetical protein M885DRAFT_111232 [Pelagophyceae sp. CCMP2097]
MPRSKRRCRRAPRRSPAATRRSGAQHQRGRHQTQERGHRRPYHDGRRRAPSSRWPVGSRTDCGPHPLQHRSARPTRTTRPIKRRRTMPDRLRLRPRRGRARASRWPVGSRTDRNPKDMRSKPKSQSTPKTQSRPGRAVVKQSHLEEPLRVARNAVKEITLSLANPWAIPGDLPREDVGRLFDGGRFHDVKLEDLGLHEPLLLGHGFGAIAPPVHGEGKLREVAVSSHTVGIPRRGIRLQGLDDSEDARVPGRVAAEEAVDFCVAQVRDAVRRHVDLRKVAPGGARVAILRVGVEERVTRGALQPWDLQRQVDLDRSGPAGHISRVCADRLQCPGVKR